MSTAAKSRSGIYIPLGLDGYELCQPVDQDEFERINVEVDGVSRPSDWRPLRMRLIRKNNGRALAASDSPWLGSHALIFRTSVVESLGRLLHDHGELLPIVCSDAGLSMYNPTRVIDALDEEESSVRRLPGGRIFLVDRYVFRAEAVGAVDVFKIPNVRVSPTFVSQRFVDRWNAAGLLGLEFKPV